MPTRGVFRCALIVLPALPCLFGCSGEVSGASREATEAPPAGPVRTVLVTHPVPVDGRDSFPSSLYIERDVRLTARNAGIIEQIRVDRGDRVRKDQILAVLETDLYAREVEMAKQRLRLATAVFDQAVSLHTDRIVSDIEKLRREIERDLAESELEVANAWLERCNIRAPFDGVIVERWAVEGRRVVEDDSTPIFRIIAADPLRARVDLPESRLAGISIGGPAGVELPGGAALAAEVIFVSPAVDAASGTAAVIVQVVSPDGAAKVGATVSVSFEETPQNVAQLLKVPRNALTRGPLIEGGASSLFVAEAGRAEERDVEVVDLFGSHVTISGGIAPDDQVILAPGPDISTGVAVQVQEEYP